ncbi:MAG: hypothetical protein ACOCV1_01485 [Bacillota bacterium]
MYVNKDFPDYEIGDTIPYCLLKNKVCKKKIKGCNSYREYKLISHKSLNNWRSKENGRY